jgi:hypothetical protein
MFVAPDSSFTLFRVRLQMAMQQNRRGGVAVSEVVSEVYRLWHAQHFDLDEVVARTGWNRSEIEYIEHWHDNDMVHQFFTLGELHSMLGEFFEELEILTPSYSWGSRFPTLVMRRRCNFARKWNG